jgi:NAD(P)-dependent dehydrogenase (short-subunit alcohol dehydrogenase family)
VLPAMLAGGRGRIVNVSSYAGGRPAPFNSAYGAAKAAVANFSESLAAEVRAGGVSVFAITPGRVRTAMTEAMLETGLFPHLEDGEWVDAGRAGELVTLLASGRADVLSGRFLHVLDDVEALVANAEEIERADTYALRVQR